MTEKKPHYAAGQRMTFQLPGDLKYRLKRLALDKSRAGQIVTPTQIAVKAIEEYLAKEKKAG